jgi:glutamate racemase
MSRTNKTNKDKTNKDRVRIGIFDTGLGGLAVVDELKKLIEKAHLSNAIEIVFLADRANFPYGPRCSNDILRLTDAAVSYLFNEQKCDYVALACNTATTALTPLLEHGPEKIKELTGKKGGWDSNRVLTLTYPTIGAVVLSIAKHSLDNIHGEADVAYVGTKATVSSGYYDTKFRGVLDRVHWHARSVFKLSADNLADLIETDGAESKKVKSAVEHICRQIKGFLSPSSPKIVPLLCTHYELVRDLFEQGLNGLTRPAEIISQSAIFANYILETVQTDGKLQERLSLYLGARQNSLSEPLYTCLATGNDGLQSDFVKRIKRCGLDYVFSPIEPLTQRNLPHYTALLFGLANREVTKPPVGLSDEQKIDVVLNEALKKITSAVKSELKFVQGSANFQQAPDEMLTDDFSVVRTASTTLTPAERNGLDSVQIIARANGSVTVRTVVEVGKPEEKYFSGGLTALDGAVKYIKHTITASKLRAG